MKVELVKEYRFEAAHKLPNVPEGHKCQRLHGHSFKFEIHVVGPVDPKSGWFIDYGVLDDVVNPLVAQLDHHYMNEIAGLENPTSENLARWIWRQLSPSLVGLSEIEVRETCDARCEYSGG